MENRSFDHMLGYLSLTGGRADIDGLRPGLANEYQGRSYPVHHLATTKVDVDPDHTASAVDVQVDGGRMGGFVASLAATIADSRVHGGDPSPTVGYYDGADVPVYDPWRRSSWSVTAGSARSQVQHGPTACTPCAGVPPAAGMTCLPMCHPYTTSRRSSGTWTSTAFPGAGTALIPRRCAWPAPATPQDTTTTSATSARPA